MKKLINRLVAIHHIKRYEAYCTVKHIWNMIDEGYSPIALLELYGLDASYECDLQLCFTKI